MAHLPRLYAEAPADPQAARFYYSLLAGILWDARENCVLLVDEGNTIGQEILRAVDRWPMRYREKAKAQLKRLKREGRFVETSADSPANPACSRPGCQRTLGIAARQQAPMVLGSAGCAGCPHVERNGVHVTDVPDYVVSEFAHQRRNSTIVLSEGEWSQADFEREVLYPIFRYAKQVKIFDRNVGRTLIRWNHQYQQEMVDAGVRDNYRRTLEWIFEQFVKITDGRPARVFEVTCGIKSSDESTVTAAARVLHEFAEGATKRHGFPMTMKVKRETRTTHMRHDRFIITNQIALMVGRGFDLLTDDGRIRDTVVTYVANAGEIEREAWDLPDVV